MKKVLLTPFLFVLLIGCTDFSPAEISVLQEDLDDSAPLVSGSSTDGPDTPVAVDDSIFYALDWDGKHPDSDQWTQHMLGAMDDLGEVLIDSRPQDVLSFCPNYDELNGNQKKWFWITLISVMTRYESSFKPETAFQEAFNDAQGNPIISRGFLQISIESGRGYDCDLPVAEVLHQPRTNLRCGVRIMRRWVDRDGVISRRVNGRWRGGARYWAVLRSFSSNDLVGKIKARTVRSEVCSL